MSTIKVNKIENTATADGGVAIDVDGHVTIDGQQLPTAGPLSNRNLIINGAMQVAQRGTSSANLNAYASVDRFRLKRVLTDELAGTQSQSTEAPSGFSNSYKVDITTAETTLAADERFSILHFIEAQNLQHLEYNTSGAKAVTLSFWVRSHVPGTYAVGLQNIDADRNIALTYSISSVDTWEPKTITFSGDTGGANPNNDNGAGFQIDWYLAAGSNFTSTDSSTWGATSDSRRAFGQSANAIGTIGGFYITGVQLEVGSKSTPFEHRSYADELARCMRYYQEYTSSTNGLGIAGAGYVETGTQTEFVFHLSTPMRTLASANITEIGDLEVRIGGSRFDVTGLTSVAFNDNFSLAVTRVTNVNSGASAGTVARLRSEGVGAGFSFNAEL